LKLLADFVTDMTGVFNNCAAYRQVSCHFQRAFITIAKRAVDKSLRCIGKPSGISAVQAIVTEDLEFGGIVGCIIHAQIN